MHGWSSIGVRAWFNSATLTCEGYKQVDFHDGSSIRLNNPGDQFNNIFIGTMGHQVTGKIEFKDEKNGIHGIIDLGNVKRK